MRCVVLFLSLSLSSAACEGETGCTTDSIRACAKACMLGDMRMKSYDSKNGCVCIDPIAPDAGASDE